MENRKIWKYLPRTVALIFFILLSQSCNDDFLDREPLDSLSSTTFWQTEEDAQLGLVGAYRVRTGFARDDFFVNRVLIELDLIGGNGDSKGAFCDIVVNGDISPSIRYIEDFWKNAYAYIANYNNFIENVANVSMDENKKAMMIAEIKTLRAYLYFNLAVYYGQVPLVTSLQTIEEANSQTLSSQEEILAFVENELKSSIEALPVARPNSEQGRITKGAALAVLGRELMYAKKWSEAVGTYKSIIDLGVYEIENTFEPLFYQGMENNKEQIWTIQYLDDIHVSAFMQFMYPIMAGGWQQYGFHNSFIETFECIDGLTIDESPLYDVDDPYENRDPRLDYTAFISDRTVFKGQVFRAHPDDADAPDKLTDDDRLGYSIKKFCDPNFSGNGRRYGGNHTIIRYAEVLLSYLESTIESGGPVTQELLDLTINDIRSRLTVEMPPVTVGPTDEMRERVRRERRVELAAEGLRYFDVLRWGIAAEELTGKFYGMKLTNDPDNYTAFEVDENGYFFYKDRLFIAGKNDFWPTPLSEVDINPNLAK